MPGPRILHDDQERRLDVRRIASGDSLASLGGQVSSSRTWTALALVYGFVVLLVVQFSRYPEWDEAVFLSQSGGFEGIESEPSALVASRERGTPLVVGLLRLLAPSLANTRLMWMGLALAVLVVATIQIGRVLHTPAILPAGLVAGYWLTYSFASSIFSFFIAGCFMLLASGLYFRIRQSRHRQWVMGLGLGLALAAGPWFRQVEGACFLLLIVAHSLLVTPRQFWSGRWRSVIAAASTFTAVFVIPWVVDSTVRFGSVRERIASGRGQSFERGLSNQVTEYIATLRGVSQTYDRLASPPMWANVALGLLLLGILAAACAGAVYRRRSRGPAHGTDIRVGALEFLWAAAASLLGLFMFFIGVVTDRYMVIGSMFLLVAASGTAWPALEAAIRSASGHSRLRRNLTQVAVAAVVIMWVVSNAVVARTYETARFMSATGVERNVALIRGLAAGGESCQGVSRYGAPQVQFGTGCNVESASSAADARRLLNDAASSGEFTFLLWPAGDAEPALKAFGSDREVVFLPSRAGQVDQVLIYTNADADGLPLGGG